MASDLYYPSPMLNMPANSKDNKSTIRIIMFCTVATSDLVSTDHQMIYKKEELTVLGDAGEGFVVSD